MITEYQFGGISLLSLPGAGVGFGGRCSRVTSRFLVSKIGLLSLHVIRHEGCATSGVTAEAKGSRLTVLPVRFVFPIGAKLTPRFAPISPRISSLGTEIIRVSYG